MRSPVHLGGCDHSVIRSGQTTKQALRRARDILMQVQRSCHRRAAQCSRPDFAGLLLLYEYQGKYSHYYQEEPPEPPAEPQSKPRAAGD